MVNKRRQLASHLVGRKTKIEPNKRNGTKYIVAVVVKSFISTYAYEFSVTGREIFVIEIKTVAHTFGK